MEFIQHTGKVVYCALCGALAGKPTECAVERLGVHKFTSSPEPEICRLCGTMPGPPSQCPGERLGCHDFGPIP